MSQPPQREPTPSETSAGDDELYEVVEPKEPAAANRPGPSASDAAAASWFVGLPTGSREGPFPLATMKQRLAAGAITRTDLVWCEGMSGWTPAGQVAALFETSASGPAPPPLYPRESRPEKDESAEQWRAASSDVMRRCDSIFERPVFFRVFGRICAVLGLLMLLIAPIAAMAGKPGWFVYVFWLVLLFLVGEAAAAILDRLDRGQQESEE